MKKNEERDTACMHTPKIQLLQHFTEHGPRNIVVINHQHMLLLLLLLCLHGSYDIGDTASVFARGRCIEHD